MRCAITTYESGDETSDPGAGPPPVRAAGIELKDQIRARPTDEDALLRVQRGAREGLAGIGPRERTGMRRRIRLLLSAPSLRARRLVNEAEREATIAEALRSGPEFRDDPYGARVVAAACVGAMSVAPASVKLTP